MAELNQQPSNTGNRKQRVRKAAPKVDLTAMVDLAFLLITFFMLTTSLNKPHSLDVAMPDNTIENTQDMDERRVVSLLIGEGKVSWYQGGFDRPIKNPEFIEFGSTDLRHTLVKMKSQIPQMAEGKDMVVLVKPSKQARAGDIINALDEIKISGVKRYLISKISHAEEDMVIRSVLTD
ncbi:biopolymer transporter ExbD [Parapedobacter sp. SGR-10]|uniref:ExbD/TolR family protein n=1 Tax=Parapedobacter sp. SGR-10 TaxID=2710879 RepID=UPI0013D8DB85|nr:biopolymer transporter ExbD [Parapedobacter sp. SGR-10]NGF55348.1 biopolymer transporter ExbD [Parapedobacter sp. SGR-10]